MKEYILIAFLVFTRSSSFTTKALTQFSIHQPLYHSKSLPLFQTNGNNDNDQDKSFAEKIDSLLDKQFFDPDEIIQTEEEKGDDGNSNPLLWFANLVKNDYETAEALFAAGFISILVILTQELLRMVKYGDAYIPFAKIGSGTLF